MREEKENMVQPMREKENRIADLEVNIIQLERANETDIERIRRQDIPIHEI